MQTPPSCLDSSYHPFLRGRCFLRQTVLIQFLFDFLVHTYVFKSLNERWNQEVSSGCQGQAGPQHLTMLLFCNLFKIQSFLHPCLGNTTIVTGNLNGHRTVWVNQHIHVCSPGWNLKEAGLQMASKVSHIFYKVCLLALMLLQMLYQLAGGGWASSSAEQQHDL